MTQKLAQGAEAIIYRDKDTIIKDRFRKTYRHKELDEKLRKTRTRREARLLQKLREIDFPGPNLIDFSDEDMKINMQFLEGDLLKNILREKPVEYSERIGELIGQLHKHDIIHADLTTSNMILVNGRIHFIDFGLSFVSAKAEDKAVDLHLLDRALESRHYQIYEECFNAAIKGYKKSYPKHKEVLRRYEQVKLRGRNKAK